ncbi:lauroyl acyltransferase [Xanthomonas fragariae]|uniref:lauroyl acyltransferase n=1 Tax=Xanthomonas fragariae TaxID=48664 RepID=UPI0015564BAB|nr:lauroyl acyltransferase [Xanthomonas fragariae]MBL9198111.1 lauroyl acyltransferase [Xanthomonas fragariae]MBL9222413.1 lauroyl acyltransferase [Xanthomonas fragariae]MDM7555265.1 lauroyl acyltransferase [Xanthomonas fragariae]MDM7558380.1 lauroyl acyltransferase [Xanthomonas fragariae]MDM7572962.1 lauroyl acyltransferase [Xanthomonas fragariae]
MDIPGEQTVPRSMPSAPGAVTRGPSPAALFRIAPMKPDVRARLLYATAAIVGRLPWPLLKRVADTLAWSWRKLNAREARVARRNLKLAYPELSAEQRAQLHAQVLQSTARQTLEVLRTWTRPPADNLVRLQRNGQELYDAALASGRGVIVAAPHFGNWELLNQWLSERGPIAIVYRPPESEAVDGFLQLARGGDNVRQVRAEGPAVRQLFKVLKEGGAVGILPDQQPKMGDGVFAPFFGIPALTMTLVNRLAERTGAIVLYGWCERADADLQFALHVQPADPAVADPDPVRAASALNAGIEQIARRDPAQYQWTYKRYTLRPPGSGQANPYATERHPH